MPPSGKCTMAHIRDVLCGYKKHLLEDKIKPCAVPKWNKFTTNSIYDMIKSNPAIMSYVPWFDEKKFDAHDVMDREWLVDTINTLDRDFFPSLIEHYKVEEFARMCADV